eukprot:GFUD01019441.1.p1 GENE.GFUD01019441.1~~GFUD01019441.1.p1  ORF type:complete len:544 (+),score=83.94 GFUD01019441.1:43-1632(+)
MANVSQFESVDRKFSLNILNFCPQPNLTKYKATLSSSEEGIQKPIILSIHGLERLKSKSDDILTNLSQIDFCPGVTENRVLPLLSQFGNVKIATVMFLIEKVDTRVVYRSRECEMVGIDKKEELCFSCSDLFRSLEQDFSGIKSEPVTCTPTIEFKNDPDEINMDEPNYITEDSFNEDFGEMDESGNTQSIDDSAQKSVSDKISCKICDKTFSSMNNLKRHLTKRSCKGTQEKNNLHDNYRKYHCKLCSNKFKFEHTLALHCKKSHNVGYLKDCPFCQIKFEISESLQDLYNHITNIHKSQNHIDEYKEIEKVYTNCKTVCPICGKTFKQSGNCSIHMAAKHETPKYMPCHICGKSLKTTKEFNALRAHMRTHDDEVAICSLCGVSLKNKMYLTAHMRIHNTIPFPCETCGKEFATKRALQEHINGVHLKKRKFKCEHCEKSFLSSWKVKVHIMSIHTKEKPFSCEKCDYRGSRIDSLRNHISAIHGQQKIGDTFKSNLDAYLSQVPDQPTVDGLNRAAESNVCSIKSP